MADHFNNVLGVILGHAEMAMDQISSNDPLYNSLEEIRWAAERSADITRQLLAFASRQGVVPKGLDLNNASTTKRIGKGTGLGLSTVYGLGKQNNGFINTSSELGQGTTFMTYLPRCTSKIEQAQPGETPDHGAIEGYETILLVEDEATILKMTTTTMLHRLGYAVLAALTTQEALRLADESTEVIHLLVTDVIMPEMNGRDLAKQLLAGKPEMKMPLHVRILGKNHCSPWVSGRGQIIYTETVFVQRAGLQSS